MHRITFAALVLLLCEVVTAGSATIGNIRGTNSCAGVSAPRFPGQTASGWSAVKLAGSLTSPRGIIIDSAGNFLIVESGKGITARTLDANGCVNSTKTVISQTNLNHGIWITPDGKTLLASSMTAVYSWSYDPTTATVSGSPNTIITGMYNGGHATRTLLMHPSNPNLLLVSHGSNNNFDYASGNINTARACIKVFDLSSVPANGYNYVTQGYYMGYGLRNEVGITFDGNNKLWGVENSADDIERTVNGQTADIHQDNPAEELNYFGDISTPNNNWYGYPTCFTVWQPSAITDRPFSVGDQFVLAPNSTFNDSTCVQDSRPPRLAFQAHSAPLDAKFDSGFNNMYVSFHGSWDRQPPTGFKLVVIPFQKNCDGSYEPKASSNETGYTDLWWNTDVTQCSATYCFRPVGIAIDAAGRMFVTSDSPVEGELFMLTNTS